jgi:hypothetical protein
MLAVAVPWLLRGERLADDRGLFDVGQPVEVEVDPGGWLDRWPLRLAGQSASGGSGECHVGARQDAAGGAAAVSPPFSHMIARVRG